MQGTRVVFLERGRVEVEDFSVAPVASHQALIRTEVSAISAGTELTTLLGGRGTERYPSYPGYSNVGVVEEIGPRGRSIWNLYQPVLALWRQASQFWAALRCTVCEKRSLNSCSPRS